MNSESDNRYFVGDSDGKVSKEATNKASKEKEDGHKSKRSKKSFKGRAPVDPEALARHSRGPGVRPERVRTKYMRKMQERREKNLKMAEETAARAEILQTNDAFEGGYLEGDETDEFTSTITQTQIKAAVDAESAAKGFELNLKEFGPYKLDYTRNGRFLALGGRRGHLAAIEWMAKKPIFEISVGQSIHDVKWLHTENMLAVAERNWTRIYDNTGTEIHVLKKLDNVTKLEFLPYHFLLTSVVRNIPY